MDESVFGFKTYQAVNILKAWSKAFDVANVSVSFSSELKLNNGLDIRDPNGRQHIIIGMGPLSNKGLKHFDPIKDSEFIAMGVTMFHELSHIIQLENDKTAEEIKLSMLSTHNNDTYYRSNWHEMPHEIDAEHSGIMIMWNQLDILSHKNADNLMISHLERKSKDTIYPIKYPDGGFISRQQVSQLFEDAYDQSLTKSRNIPDGYLRSDDEVAIMLSDNGILKPEYMKIFNDLVISCSDRKMASLTSYIHPELQPLYAGIDFAGIHPRFIYDIEMIERPEDIINKIEENNFTKSVNNITKDNGISL